MDWDFKTKLFLLFIILLGLAEVVWFHATIGKGLI